jgi:hypothetical protein
VKAGPSLWNVRWGKSSWRVSQLFPISSLLTTYIITLINKQYDEIFLVAQHISRFWCWTSQFAYVYTVYISIPQRGTQSRPTLFLCKEKWWSGQISSPRNWNMYLRFIDHTQTPTLGRTPLNEWPARRRGHYLPIQHTTHTREEHPYTLAAKQTRDPRKRAAADLRLKRHNHRDRPLRLQYFRFVFVTHLLQIYDDCSNVF